MRGPCAQGEVVTGEWALPERADEGQKDMGLIIDPLENLLGVAGRRKERKEFWFFEHVEDLGGEQKRGV